MKHLVFTLVLFLAGMAHAEDLTLLTEEYAPYNFSKDGAITGTSVEQAELMMKALGLGYSLEILPWARALSRTEQQPHTCLFTTGHDQDRDKRFKWVEPLLVDQMIMVRKAGSGVNPATIDEAKRFIVGAQREDFAIGFLRNNNFPKIDLATDLETTEKKLLSGRVDLMVTSEKTFEAMRDRGSAVESALTLEGQRYGFACNLALPDELIARMQKELDRLIADGTQDRILTRYGVRPNRR